MEKQLGAVYATLLSTKVITGKALVHVKTTYWLAMILGVISQDQRVARPQPWLNWEHI